MDPLCSAIVVVVMMFLVAYMVDHHLWLMRRILSDVVRLLYGGVTGEAPPLFVRRPQRPPDG